MLILFPIAFLAPVVQRLWGQAADIAFAGWYWRVFGERHRALVARLRRWPVTRSIIGGIRVLRIRYLCAWRLWRYDPRYRKTDVHARRVSLIEPIRLWRQGGLDGYIGRPLLAGERDGAACATAAVPAP